MHSAEGLMCRCTLLIWHCWVRCWSCIEIVPFVIQVSQICIQDNLRCHTVVMFFVTNSHRSVIFSLPIGVLHWATFGALFMAKYSVSKHTLLCYELIWSPLCFWLAHNQWFILQAWMELCMIILGAAKIFYRGGWFLLGILALEYKRTIWGSWDTSGIPMWY
jgi:hypothetical protein